MKKHYFFIAFLLCYSLLPAQVQIGQDIDGEADNDEFGNRTSISGDGTIVAGGAFRNAGNGPSSGHVRVYKYQNNNWIQIGQDIDGEAQQDESGTSISLSADGKIVAIGSWRNDGNGEDSGHVRIYENQNDTWIQIGQDIDGETEFDQSGRSIDLSSDGSIVAIGAPSNDGSAVNAGHVRVYENLNGNWIQIGQDIDGESTSDFSGNSVSLSSNGRILAIGATGNDGNGLSSGHVRIYENQSSTWIQIGQDIDGESNSDFSGRSVSISSNGGTVAIGANGNDGAFGFATGHIRVFDLNTVLSNQEQELITFSLHPNPAKTKFSVDIPRNSILQNIYIYSITGQLVKISKNNTVDISKLASGLYTIEIETDKGKNTKKLLIN